jgi:DNA-binding GntR family transcriptional regulator
MPKLESALPRLLDVSVKIEANLLKNQAVDLLRNKIVRGELPPGTQLAEREVADLLGISRIPVRDALNELQTEGLVVTKNNRRYVIELNERDVRELYETRLALEKLAVQLATKNTSAENGAALDAIQREMKAAVGRKDVRAYVQSDLDTHRLIWRQANNRHLHKTLSSMAGPIFMFVATNAELFDWNETVNLHQNLISSINRGDAQTALDWIEQHMDSALYRSLQMFSSPKGSDLLDGSGGKAD